MTDFKPGDKVRIIDSRKNSEHTYLIKKIEKSQDGTTIYFLHSDPSSEILIFYEGKESHLQMVK